MMIDREAVAKPECAGCKHETQPGMGMQCCLCVTGVGPKPSKWENAELIEGKPDASLIEPPLWKRPYDSGTDPFGSPEYIRNAFILLKRRDGSAERLQKADYPGRGVRLTLKALGLESLLEDPDPKTE